MSDQEENHHNKQKYEQDYERESLELYSFRTNTIENNTEYHNKWTPSINSQMSTNEDEIESLSTSSSIDQISATITVEADIDAMISHTEQLLLNSSQLQDRQHTNRMNMEVHEEIPASSPVTHTYFSNSMSSTDTKSDDDCQNSLNLENENEMCFQESRDSRMLLHETDEDDDQYSTESNDSSFLEHEENEISNEIGGNSQYIDYELNYHTQDTHEHDVSLAYGYTNPYPDIDIRQTEQEQLNSGESDQIQLINSIKAKQLQCSLMQSLNRLGFRKKKLQLTLAAGVHEITGTMYAHELQYVDIFLSLVKFVCQSHSESAKTRLRLPVILNLNRTPRHYNGVDDYSYTENEEEMQDSGPFQHMLHSEPQINWPVFDMAQFEFGSAHPNTNFDCVLMLTNLPQLSQDRRSELLNLLSKQIFSMISDPIQVVMPYDPQTGHVKGFAFLEFDHPATAKLCCVAIQGLTWGQRNTEIIRAALFRQYRAKPRRDKDATQLQQDNEIDETHLENMSRGVDSENESFHSIRSLILENENYDVSRSMNSLPNPPSNPQLNAFQQYQEFGSEFNTRAHQNTSLWPPSHIQIVNQQKSPYIHADDVNNTNQFPNGAFITHGSGVEQYRLQELGIHERQTDAEDQSESSSDSDSIQDHDLHHSHDSVEQRYIKSKNLNGEPLSQCNSNVVSPSPSWRNPQSSTVNRLSAMTWINPEAQQAKITYKEHYLNSSRFITLENSLGENFNDVDIEEPWRSYCHVLVSRIREAHEQAILAGRRIIELGNKNRRLYALLDDAERAREDAVFENDLLLTQLEGYEDQIRHHETLTKELLQLRSRMRVRGNRLGHDYQSDRDIAVPYTTTERNNIKVINQSPIADSSINLDEFTRQIHVCLAPTTLSSKSLEDLKALETILESSLTTVRSVKNDKTIELEKERERHIEEQQEQKLCVICLSNDKSILCLPCRHLCLCEECSSRQELDRCPICRLDIEAMLHVYA